MNVIYVDELFFLNALTDYLLLLSCARLRGKTLRRGRFAAAAAVGGVYAVFAAIPPLSFLVSLAAKALVSLLMAWIAFSAPPELWRGWGCFLALSSAFAGAVYGISLLSGVEPRGVLSGASLKTLVLSFGLCYAAVRLFFGRFLRRRERCIVDAEIVLCGRTASLRALRDTGNALFDPLSGSRILLAEPRSLASLFSPPLAFPLPDDPAACFRTLSSHPALLRRLRLVGFSAVGTKRGLLVCFRPDAVTVEGTAESYLVALSPTPLGDGEYSALV